MWETMQISEILHYLTYKLTIEDYEDIRPCMEYFNNHQEGCLISRFFFQYVQIFIYQKSGKDLFPSSFFNFRFWRFPILNAYMDFYQFHRFSFFQFENFSQNLLEFYENLNLIPDDVYQNRQRLQIGIYRQYIQYINPPHLNPPSFDKIPPLVVDFWKIKELYNIQKEKDFQSNIDLFIKNYGNLPSLTFYKNLNSIRLNPSLEKIKDLTLPLFHISYLEDWNRLYSNSIFFEIFMLAKRKDLSDLCVWIQENKLEPIPPTYEFFFIWKHVETVQNSISSGTDNYLTYVSQLFDTQHTLFTINVFHDLIALKYVQKENLQGLCELYDQFSRVILFSLPRMNIRSRLNLILWFIMGFLKGNRLPLISIFKNFFLDIQDLLPENDRTKGHIQVLLTKIFQTELCFQQKGFTILQEENLSTTDCVICLEPLQQSILQCTHCKNKIGHFFCLSEWFYIHEQCPLCRK